MKITNCFSTKGSMDVNNTTTTTATATATATTMSETTDKPAAAMDLNNIPESPLPMMTLAEKENKEMPPKGPLLGIRHLQIFLLFLGLSVAYAQRVNLSVAIVAMTDKNSANPDFDEFDWSEQTKSLLLSSFFWGYIFTQVPAGQLARKFGGKIMMISGLTICAVLNILTPIFAKIGGWEVVCALRVLEGLSQGVVFPSAHTLLSKWVPPNERASLGTCAYAGSQFGTIVMLATSGVIASSSLGWPSIFYISGGVGIIWAVIFSIWGASSPSEFKRISQEEKNLIETLINEYSGKQDHAPVSTPWLSFVTSMPFLVLVGAHSSHNWGFWTLLTEIPSYMKNVLHKDIKANALLSSLPYIAMFIMSFVFSAVSAQLNKHNCISTVVSRKLFNTIGTWIPMISLVSLGYVGADQTNLAVILLTITVGINAATYLGFQMNHIDLSPNYAGILMGITNCVANIMSIIAPLIVGFIITDETDPEEWRIIFFIAAGFYFVGNLLFIIFGKANVQPWNNPPEKPNLSKRNSTQVESQH